MFLGFYAQELEGDASLTKMEIKGDLVVSKMPDAERYHAILEKIIGIVAGTRVKLTIREVERPVIVFKGKWKAKTVDGAALPAGHARQCIELYGARFTDPPIGSTYNGDVDKLAKSIGQWIDKTVVIQASDAPQELSWLFRHPQHCTEEVARAARDPELVCTRLQEQTGLERTEETCKVRRLFIERENG